MRIAGEVYNCITILISSRPQNERNKIGRSAQFSLNLQKNRWIGPHHRYIHIHRYKYIRIYDRWEQENNRRFREGGIEASTFGLPDIELLSIISTKGTDGYKVNCANK